MTRDHLQRERPIAWWLRHVEGLLEVSFERALEREGIARPHWQVLNVVAGGAGSVSSVLAAIARHDGGGNVGGPSGAPARGGADTRAAVDQLVATGWLHARGEQLALTPGGETARERLSTAVRANQERSTSGVDAERYRVTVETLRIMARNLSEPGRPG
ncbi:MAG TPA: hypothetical protein VGH99_01850 [Pseudonocardia sp.]